MDKEGARLVEWTSISPKSAQGFDLTKRLDITAPLNEQGERCPWPWDPQQLVGSAMGQYHCRYCGAMVVAGLPHIDYAPEDFVLRGGADAAGGATGEALGPESAREPGETS